MKNYCEEYANAYTTKVIGQIFLENINQKELEAYFENKQMLPNIHLIMTNYYIIHLIEKKDFTSAKFFALKLKELDMDKIELHDYYLTLMLLNYIEELEMSNL